MVDTVQNMVAPDGLKDLLDPRNSNNLSGFQRAHIIGRAFLNQSALDWFRNLIGGADNALNGVLLPEGNRGGLALGVAEHFGNDVDAFNRLFYDVGGGPDSQKFLNVLERTRVDDLFGISDQNRIDEINTEYKIKSRNFLDFVKIQFLHQDILDKLEIDGVKIEGLKSLARSRTERNRLMPFVGLYPEFKALRPLPQFQRLTVPNAGGNGCPNCGVDG